MALARDDQIAEIGVIGGSGFYSFLTGARPVPVETPFGAPSEPPVVGEVEGRRVAFIPRHGADHRFPPHRVNYRANLWALRSLGVRQVLGPCAVGSLRPELTPGTIVVPDQFVDRTWGREHTLYDGRPRGGAHPEPRATDPKATDPSTTGLRATDPSTTDARAAAESRTSPEGAHHGRTSDGGAEEAVGPVVHVSPADPYCPAGRATVIGAGEIVAEGTMVVINGPRFSTRAESRWHAAQGWSLVGMTGAPEASIARELAVCYTSVAVVTDHDAGVVAGEGVTHAEVLAQFGRSIERLKVVLTAVIGRLPAAGADCVCRHSLDGIPLPFELP